MLLVSLLLMGLLHCILGAPAGREVYRMPPSALKAMSDRGTVVLEAALTSALSALERASSERSRAEAGCKGCVPCLFQDCGQRSGSCSSPSSASSEPSCDLIGRAQKIQDEGERSWALSQACGFYRHRCPPGELGRDTCVRVMGESCAARVLQCSLLRTLQNLEPATQAQSQAVCGQRLSAAQNVTQPRSRIVGGSPAPPGSWPWLVNLQLDGGLMCGGVLVDSSWVVTAAHCFASRSESYWSAVVGEFDITKADPDEQILNVNRIIPHPKFNPKTFNNDIALVELTTPVVLSDHVTPVCLPSDTDPPTGSPCLVAGWGSLSEGKETPIETLACTRNCRWEDEDGPAAEIVMEAKVPLLPQSTCKSTLGKELVTNTMLCAGYLSGGIDSCQGDSGGPLIYQDHTSGRFQLYGITSWGDGCGEKGKPGVYTRVSAFSDWIQAEIQKAYGSREPTCPELLRTSDMSEEDQRTEFSSLCHFYTLSCLPGQTTGTCARMAQDKCLKCFKKCQLRSFLQTLLDLLQRAEDYVRDTVDLTFFTQTLPQLVEHIYSTAFTHARQKRDLGTGQDLLQTVDVLSLAVQLGGAVRPEQQAPPPTRPTLFREVGPMAADWGGYLRGLAEDLDEHRGDTSADVRQEDILFLQVGEPSVLQLEGEYQSVISALRSKLESRAAPPILHLDASFLEEVSPSVPASPTALPGSLMPPRSSSSKESQAPGTVLSALLSDIGNFKAQGGTVRGGTARVGDTLPVGVSPPAATRQGVTEDPTGGGPGAGAEQTSPVFPAQSTTVTGEEPIATTSDTRHTAVPLQPSNLHRKRRDLLRKRQLTASICPGLTESLERVSQVSESYRWILGIPAKNLHMNFHEVLVDLSSKNDRGLYQARVRAIVGGRPLTFYSLVGLENESFYRSMPRVIALALEALKT